MNKRRLTLLFMGIILLATGVGLIVYGYSSQPNMAVQNSALRTYEVNILMLIGVPPVCIGAALLLFWIFTRSKTLSPHS